MDRKFYGHGENDGFVLDLSCMNILLNNAIALQTY